MMESQGYLTYKNFSEICLAHETLQWIITNLRHHLKYLQLYITLVVFDCKVPDR